MKKFSKLAGILMALCLLGTFFGCKQSLNINLESPKIDAKQPVFTGRSVKLTWTPNINSTVMITRQEKVDGSKEILLVNAYGKTGVFYDRISYTNELKNGSTYIYRFYNTDEYGIDGSAETGRAISEATVTKKYSCTTQEITITEDFVKKGEKLEPFNKETFKVNKFQDVKGRRYINYSVKDDEEAEYTIEYSANGSSWAPIYYYDNPKNVGWSSNIKVRAIRTWPNNYYSSSEEYIVDLEKGLMNLRLDKGYSDKIVLTWKDEKAGKLDYKVTAKIKKVNPDYTEIPVEAKITSDEYSNYSAIITLAEMKKLGLPLGTTINSYTEATDISEIEFTISATDADGVKHSETSGYEIDYWKTTYTSIETVSANYDSTADKLYVNVGGYNLDENKIKIYYELNNEIKPLKGAATKYPATPSFGSSSTYTYTISEPGLYNSYKFYVRIEDTYEYGQAFYIGGQGTKLVETECYCF